MSKINLTDATTLTNETSFISTLNANYATIETASDLFLSRDGTSPNSMSANLDMNSNRITNLPTPVLSNDVVRLQDMVTFTGGGTIAAFPTTSAGIASAISDETGTGSLVFATSPTLVTPVLGAATGTSLVLSGAAALSATATNAGIELGSSSISNTPFIDFHSSGNVNDYDSRLIAFGGSASPGTGGLSIVGTAGFIPNANDTAALGNTTNMWSDLFLASGGVINWNAGDVTLTHSANLLALAGASSGYTFDAVIKPSANDGAALGASGTAWSDLFLASGAVIDFGAGNVTCTHAGGALTFANTSMFMTGSMTILTGTAVPAGGTASTGYKLSSTSNLGIFFGSGAPTLAAAQGSIYIRTDGSSTSTRLHINTNGSTTWTNVTTAA